MPVAHYYAGPAAVTFTPRDTSTGALVPAQAVVLGVNRDASPVHGCYRCTSTSLNQV